MAENKSIFDSNEFSKDENLPLEELLNQMKSEENEVKKPYSKPATTVEKPVEKREQELSPLEQLKRQKEGINHGLIVSNEELKAGEDGPKENIVYNENRMKAIEDTLNEYDETMKKRDAIIVTHQPMNQVEYITLVTEIDSVAFDETGKAYFTLVDNNGNPVAPKFCRLREQDEKAFDYSVLSEYEQKEINKKENKEDVSDEAEETISEEKRKIVEILIDKTGLGSDFAFTEEEKVKISEAETIKINEVKLIDIAAIRAKRSQKSFQDTINEFNTKGSRTTICFPASGFRAQMKGLTYGEYADISLSMENVTFEQYHKRLSIIYNKMTNISTGPFENFEDFLKHFAYTDIPLAIYGMFVATEQENQQIALRCGNENCKKSFDWTYSTRSILRLERCADTFLKKMQEIASAPAMEYDNIKANSAVENSKVIELPESKFAVEMGIASAYDFLYNFIPLMDEETFKAAFGDDLNEIYMNNILLLTTVRSVYVPNGDEYIECVGYKDILDAIYNISPTEIQILAAYASKIQSEYEVSFSFENVQCPHCHNVTKHLDITIDDLVNLNCQIQTSLIAGNSR